MMKRMTIAALAVLILAAMPGVALAQETDQADRQTTDRPVTDAAARIAGHIEEIKARALAAIDKRLATVAELEAALDRVDFVPARYVAILAPELQKTARGLESLTDKIRAATEIGELRELVPQIFDFGVYKTLAPKVHLTLAASHGVSFANRLEEFAGHLDEVLGRMAEYGIDVSEAAAKLAEMQRSVASGKEKAASVPEMVINLAPSDPEAEEILHQARSILESAGDDLRSAAEAAHDVVSFIRRVLGQD